MNTRETNEALIKEFAQESGMVDINPSIDTHLGRITLLDDNARLIEEVDGNWCIQGTLDQLTDQEFNQVFSAVQGFASKVMAYAVSK